LPIPRAAPRRPPSRLLHTGTSRFDQHAIKPSASQQRRGTAVRESGAWGTSWGTHGVLSGTNLQVDSHFAQARVQLGPRQRPTSKPDRTAQRPMCAAASLAAHAAFALGRRGHERMRVCVSVRRACECRRV
jgi:hypothetical protein